LCRLAAFNLTKLTTEFTLTKPALLFCAGLPPADFIGESLKKNEKKREKIRETEKKEQACLPPVDFIGESLCD
jgi:hypothetical protein